VTASGALAGARRGLRNRPLPETFLFFAVLCLVGTVLLQAPLVEVDTGGGAYLVRSWDLVSLAIGGLALWWLIRTNVTPGELTASAIRPYLLFAVWVLVSVMSLVVTWATFGSDGFVDSLVRGLRLAGVLVLAAIVCRLGRGVRGEQLVLAFLIVASVGAVAAAWAWLTYDKTVAGEVLGVTRAGGPFGNYFADGIPDQWWAGPAGPNNLGLWLATALATVIGGATRVAALTGRRALGLIVVAISVAVLLLGLAATHSRESWLAAAVAVLVLLFARPMSTGRRWEVIGLAAAVAVGIAVFASVPSISGRIGDTLTPGTFSYETGPRARIEAWQDSLSWGWERFPIGWGLGGMEEHPENFGRASAENVFLQSFVANGVFGLTLLIVACALAVAAALRRYVERSTDLRAVFPAAFFTAFCVHGLFGNSLTDPTVETLFGCALGLLMAGTGDDGVRAREGD
jgi:O-Antigen ligase